MAVCSFSHVFVGGPWSGKTSTWNALVNEVFNENEESTHGVHASRVNVDANNMIATATASESERAAAHSTAEVIRQQRRTKIEAILLNSRTMLLHGQEWIAFENMLLIVGVSTVIVLQCSFVMQM